MESKKIEIIEQGSALVKNELDMKVEVALRVRNDFDLDNSELLSNRLIINRDIHQTIKKSIQEYSENIKKIIAATAYFIEEEGFQNIDEAVRALEIESKKDKNRLNALVYAQKEIKLSYGTLIAVTEIFKTVNKSILTDFEHNEGRSSAEMTKILLKNSILVYEFTNFMITFLKEFQLTGIDDLKAIRNDVFTDIQKSRRKNEELKEKILSYPKERQNGSILNQIESRSDFMNVVEKKWDDIFQKISGQEESFKKSALIISDLEINRDNASLNMDMLNIASTTGVVSDSVSAIESLAAGMDGWELPDLDEQLAKELLNIDF